ncbi:MAG TPA: prepilin-type N-terminal cleavage/methylation domain-containing protein [Planctomycetota bacterium]|nr:prepilin-type N-terminal cleavage/methylation domain-containing protein [Planctomycetota bacterium]
MTPRSGMTLVEVAVSLALLSTLFAASSWWIAEAGRAQAEEPRLALERSAEALLLDLERRLREGDEPDASGRVAVEDEQLRLLGRGERWTAIEYREHERAVAVDGEVVLGNVVEARFELDEEVGELRVLVAGARGRAVERTWRLP